MEFIPFLLKTSDPFILGILGVKFNSHEAWVLRVKYKSELEDAYIRIQLLGFELL